MLKLLFLIFLLASSVSFSQCLKGDCENGYGVFQYKDGTKYIGDFLAGKQNGKGKLSFTSGSYSEGDFKDGYFEGSGVKFIIKDSTYVIANWTKDTIKDGDITIKKKDRIAFQGKIKGGKQNGFGKFYFDDGSYYEGNFLNNEFSGNGLMYYADNSKYVGEFKNEYFEGMGKFYYPNGDRFEGVYKKGKKNGAGVLYFANGGKIMGEWKNDEFISGGDTKGEKEIQEKIVKLLRTESNLFEIPIKINNVLDIPFIMDTGASETFLTADVVMTLYRAHTITDADLLEGDYFTDAQGKVNYNARFKIREINIGGIIIKNVSAGIASTINASNLLGQNVLSKLGKFTIDYSNNTLRICE